jgi:hypothetical protein
VTRSGKIADDFFVNSADNAFGSQDRRMPAVPVKIIARIIV